MSVSAYRTPQSNRLGRFSQSLANVIKNSVSPSTVKSAYKTTSKLYKALRGKPAAQKLKQSVKKKSNKGNSKHSYVVGSLAGKSKGPGKMVSRKTISKKGGMSKYGMAQKGITYREEFRKQDGITANESRLIGHTSLPVQATYYNIFRSLVKTLYAKAGIHIDALTSNAGLSNSAIPTIVIAYYDSWTSTNLSSQTWTPSAVIAGGTWQAYCDDFADWFKGQFVEDPRSIRWVHIELRPPATANILNPQRVRMSLAQSKFDIRSKSALKFQNQSGIYATDSTVLNTDDLNSVPIECHMFYVVGNQFINQNRKVSGTIGLGSLGFDNTYTVGQIGSEPAPAYEILNCTGKEKIYMDPGHVKTSIISHRSNLSFGNLIRMLLRKDPTIGTAGWLFSDTVYNRALGHSRAIHCDRVLGSSTGSVRLMIEIELTQQVVCSGKLDTATDQYEVQRS